MRAIRVQHPGGAFTLLATGDSMIQPTDEVLRERLGPHHVRVITDSQIGSGISKPQFLDWVAHARSAAARIKPDITVMFIGANEGFALQNRRGNYIFCCSRAWTALYAARVRLVMAAYLRGGRGRLYWLMLPTAQNPQLLGIFNAVNAGFRIAAASFPHGVRLIPTDQVLAPGGHYTQSIHFDGQTLDPREPDGIHISFAGSKVAAALTISAMVADGVFG